VNLWYSWAGASVGALLIPLLAAYGRHDALRASSGWVAAAMLSGAGVALAWLAYGLQTDNPYLTVQMGSETLSVGTLLPGLAVSGLFLGIGQILAIIRKRP
jgi:hypothetical protein